MAAKRPRTRLLSWAEIKPWQKDNEYILTSYRIPSFSFSESAKSIFQLHNETANIWSHLLGAVWFLLSCAKFSSFADIARSNPPQDSIAIGVYYLGVIVCFLLSAAFHTFSDHSPHMHRFGNELDHLGIVLVMWGTGMSGTHFAFYCRRPLRDVYLASLTATAVGCGLFTLRPKFRQPAYRTARVAMYAFLGASLFAPVVHGLWLQGYRGGLREAMGLDSFLGLAFVNFTGAAIYAARIPERWYPETFDLVGQSHNLMHAFVLAGALIRLQGLLETAQAWQALNDRVGVCGGAGAYF